MSVMLSQAAIVRRTRERMLRMNPNLKLVSSSGVRHGLKPKVFTSQEQVIDAVREGIFTSGLTYDKIAEEAGVSATTVRRLASGDTRWPRHTTLFPVLHAIGLGIKVVKA